MMNKYNINEDELKVGQYVTWVNNYGFRTHFIVYEKGDHIVTLDSDDELYVVEKRKVYRIEENEKERSRKDMECNSRITN
jgi:plastocyanin